MPDSRLIDIFGRIRQSGPSGTASHRVGWATTRRRVLQGLGGGVAALGASSILKPPRSAGAQPADRSILTFRGHAEGVSSVAFSPDGRTVLSGSIDKTLKLWEVATGKNLLTFQGHSDEVFAVAFSPDGRSALSGSKDETLKLWDVATGRDLRTFSGHSERVKSVAFSPDGRTALSSGYEAILWEIETGDLLQTLGDFSYSVFSPDGRTALLAAGRSLELHDIETGETIRTFTGHSDDVYSLAFSPNGQTVLSGSADRTLKLWEVATGKELRTFRGHTGQYFGAQYLDWVLSVAFSPDGQTALSGGGDYTVRVWDVASGRSLRVLNGHTAPVTSVAFSPDGRTAVSGGFDNMVKLWDVAGR